MHAKIFMNIYMYIKFLIGVLKSLLFLNKNKKYSEKNLKAIQMIKIKIRKRNFLYPPSKI